MAFLLLRERVAAVACAVSIALGAALSGPAPFGALPALAQEGTDQGAWRRLPPVGLSFGPGGIAIEPSTGRVLAIGADGDGYVLWSYDRSLGDRPWRTVRIAGQIPRSGQIRYVFDEVGERFLALVVHIEESDTYPPETRLDTWSLSVREPVRWEQLTVSGEQVTGRYDPAIAIDSPGRRVFLLGGEELFSSGDSGYRGDLWQLQLEPPISWQRVSLLGPDLPGGGGGKAFFETNRQRLVVVGGYDTLTYTSPARRVRAVDLAGARTWYEPTASDTTRTEGIGPGCYDPDNGTFMYLHRGFEDESPDSTYLSVLDLVGSGGWSRRPFTDAPRPLLEGYGELHLDRTTDRVIYLGGRGTRGEVGMRPTQHVDVWSFPRAAIQPSWSREYSSIDEGYLEIWGPMALDAERRRIYALPRSPGFGLYVYRYDDPPGWDFLAALEPAPSYREGPVTIFDPRWNRLIYFGGGADGVEYGDLWECSLGGVPLRWKRLLSDEDVPLPRIFASAVHDPVRHRMVLFGGFAGRPLNDAWQLDLRDSIPRWTRISSRGTAPPPRWGHSAVYDMRRDAMVVFGGAGGDLDGPSPINDGWVMSFVDRDVWIPLVPEGNPPIARYRHAALYEPVGDRMVVLWGRDASGGRFDSASLEFAPDVHWEPFAPVGMAPSAREGASFFYDARGDRAIALSGWRTAEYNWRQMRDAWSIDWNRLDRTPPPLTAGGPAFTIRSVGPNPSKGEVNIAFELPRPTAVHTRLYDVRGRQVRDLGPTFYQPGPHVLFWDGRSDAGERCRDGVYFARILVEGVPYSGKIVLMD